MPGPALFVPIRARSHTSGYLALCRERGQPPFDESEARTVTLLAAWVGLALENLRLAERVEKLAITDDLTQVYNYRFLKTALRREIRRATRFSQEMSLVMIGRRGRRTASDREQHLRLKSSQFDP